jgi:hypothetical protein
VHGVQVDGGLEVIGQMVCANELFMGQIRYDRMRQTLLQVRTEFSVYILLSKQVACLSWMLRLC